MAVDNRRCGTLTAPYNELIKTMSAEKQRESNDARKDPEAFRTVPNDSEEFGSVPQPSEAFRTGPNDAEARESHTLTVKQVARMFEEAGVARTERSVVNWCKPTAGGDARLDSYFDLNERKHFITPESVDRAIQEELAKAGVASARPRGSQGIAGEEGPESEKLTKELRHRIRDLEISNRAKDMFIEQIQADRTRLVEERQTVVAQLAESNRTVGKLEEKLHRLEAPKEG